jgi:hypothetical protein
MATFSIDQMQRIRDVISKDRPEILEGIARDTEKAERYVSFLISTRHQIPEILINAVSNNPNISLKIAISLAQRKQQVPENILNSVLSDPKTIIEYVSRIPQITPELLQKISEDKVALRLYLKRVITVNIKLPLTSEMIKKASEYYEDFPTICLTLSKIYLRYNIPYKNLNQQLINGICSDSSTAESFAHFVQKYTADGKVPARISKAVQNPEKIKPNWHKGGDKETEEKSFEQWYKERNPRL